MLNKNNNKPLFSIITVCFNSEKTIEQTIQSILKQTFKDFEYIIIDGGSKDSTLEIINKYRDHIKTVVSEKDDGIYDAMNKGIVLAKGSIIGLLNSDDWYEPETLQIVAEEYLQSDGETLFHGLCKLIENGKEGSIISYHHDVLPYYCICHTSCFLPKKLYVKYGLFDTSYKIAGDYELLLRLYLSGVRFKRLEKILVNFRSGGVSDSLKSTYEDIKIQYHHKLFGKNKYYMKLMKHAVVHVSKALIVRSYQKLILGR